MANTGTFAAIRSVAVRHTFFRDLMLLCAGLSVSALAGGLILVDLSVSKSISSGLCKKALAAGRDEVDSFAMARFGPTLASLTDPAHRETSLGEYVASLDSKGAASIHELMIAWDDPSKDSARVLALSDPERTGVKDLSRELADARARFHKQGIRAISILFPRPSSLFSIDSAQGVYPWVSMDPDQRASNLVLKKRALAGDEACTITPYEDEWDTWYSAYVPLRDGNGTVIAVVETDVVGNAVPVLRSALQRAAWIGLFPVAFLAALASAVLARRFSRRISVLTDAIRRLASGDFSARVADERNDELGAMGRAFNTMALALAEKDRMRAVLEESVSRSVAKELLRGDAVPELREATVLFSDIRGYTAMSEEMDSVAVVELLNEYFSEMAPIVERHGGVVDKFIGDGMLSVFGAPEFVPNDAQAAVLTALEMIEALRAFNDRRRREGKREIEIGIGINTGMLIAGSLGSKRRRNYTVLGSTVNIGARLCSKAKPMSIVVSAATAARVKSIVDVREIEALQLKGITGPFEAFEVLPKTS